ncbi:MAG: PQQ-binding-like beta-propeller repeat protein [Elusimicrobia bacterium]|nr:PQQ-binding-like beta-propeller repeat protein [Elusimicrobiota bacterium]
MIIKVASCELRVASFGKTACLSFVLLTLNSKLATRNSFADISTGTSFNNILQSQWSYAFENVYGGFYRMIPGPSAAIGELRGDYPGLEIVTGNEEYYPLGDEVNESPLGRWFMFAADGRVIWWKDTENDEAHSSLGFADINGDGQPDIVGGTTSGNQVQSFDGNTNWNWKNPHNGHVLSTPALARVGNSEWRIFSGSFDYSVKGLRGTTGQSIWRFGTRGPIWSSAAVGDLDGNGEKEIVIGSDDGNLYCLGSSTGALRWSRKINGELRGSAALADLNSDGQREVIVGTPWVSSGTVLALDAKTGATIWSFPTSGSLISSPAVGDVDGDGRLDIVIGSGDGHVYCLNNDGSLKWTSDLRSPIYSSPALAPRGPGNRLDVYIVSFAGYLSILQGDTGVLLDSFRASYTAVSSPVVADINGDGKLEIVFQDRFGDINKMRRDRFWCVTDTGSQVPAFSRPWPMFRSNPSHTGVFMDNETERFVNKPDQEPPLIMHTPIASPWPDNNSITVTAQITDNIGVIMAGLTFWETGTQRYNTIPMNRIGLNTYSAVIPSFYLQGIRNKSLSYFVDATDDAGNYPPTGQTPGSFSAPNKVMINDLSFPSATIWNPRNQQMQGKIANWSGGFSPADVAKVQLRLQNHETGLFWFPEGWGPQETWFSANYLRLAHQSNMAGNGSWQHQSDGITFKNGSHYTLWSRAVDSSGNQGAVKSTVAFTADTEPPAISISEPEAGTTYYENLTRFSGSARDELSGLSYIYLVIKDRTRGLIWDGSTWQSYYAYVQPALSGSTWTYPAPALAPMRTYEITAFAMDKALNGKTVTGKFFIDSSMLPAPEKIYGGWAWTSADHLDRQISWQSSLSTANVKSFRVYVQNPGQSFFTLEREIPAGLQNFEWSEQSSATVVLSRNANTGTYTYTLRRPGNNWPVGRWTFHVKAVSRANIEGDPSIDAFVAHAGPLDITSTQGAIPVVAFQGPLNDQAGYLNIGFFTQPTAWSAGSKIVAQHKGSEILVNTLDGKSSTATLKTGTTYYVQVLKKLNDPQNGETVSLSRNKWAFIYDREAPVSKIIEPAGQSILGSLGRIAGTAEDTGNGLSSVALSIQRTKDSLFFNGGDWTSTETLIAAQGASSWEIRLPSNSFITESSYIIRSKAKDTAGNEERASGGVSFSIDRTPPSTTITLEGARGADNFFTGSAYVTLQSSDALAGVDKIMLRLDNGPWQVDAGTNIISTAGKHVIEYYAVDRVGNEEAVQMSSFIQDLTPPESAITLFSDTLAAGTAKDNFSGVAAVETALRDITLDKFWNQETFASNDPVWLPQEVASGVWTMKIPALTQSHSYELRSRAKDLAGLTENPAKIAYKLYDVAPPVSAVQTPHDQSTVRLFDGISGTANDADSGLQRILISLKRLSDGKTMHADEWNDDYFWHQIEGKEKWSWAMPGGQTLAEGRYEAASLAVDKNGNLETNASTVTFSYDDTAPLTTALIQGAELVGEYYGGPIQVILAAKDSLSGVNLTHYRIDYNAESSSSNAVVPDDSLGFGSWKTYQATLTISNSGDHTLEFYSMDAVGNTEASHKVEFKIDAEAPTAAISQPLSQAALQSLASINGTAADEASGLAQIEISLKSLTLGLGFLNSGAAWQDSPAWISAGKKSPWMAALPLALPEGRYEASVRASDLAGHLTPPSAAAGFAIDQTPPKSQAKISGLAAKNGWFHSAVTAGAVSTDTLSGVRQIFCRISPQKMFTSCVDSKIVDEGTALLEFYAQDQAGNEETPQSAAVPIDLTMPDSTITGISAQEARGTAQDDGGSGLEMIEAALRDATDGSYWDGQGFASSQPSWIALPATSTWRFSMPPLASGHRYEFETRAGDRSGWAQESPAHAEFLHDITPPLSKITKPLAQSIQSGLKSIQGTSSDDGSGIAGVDVQLKRLADNTFATAKGWSQKPSWIMAEASLGPWTLELSSALPLTEGQFSVMSRARDLNGNLEIDPGPISFSMDTTPPQTTINISGVKGSNSYFAGNVSIVLSASDSLSGIRETRFRLDAGSWQNDTGTITVESGGDHAIEFFSVDQAGLEEKISLQSFRIDQERPLVSILWPATLEVVTAAEEINISGKASDAVSGLERLAVTLTEIKTVSHADDHDKKSSPGEERGEIQTLAVTVGADGAWTALVKGIKSGCSFEINAQATDRAGLADQTSSRFNTVAPGGHARASIKNPNEGKKVSGNAVTIMAEATQNTKGVLFQYRNSADRTWTDITSRDDKQPFSVYWNVSALPNGTYHLRGVAYDSQELPDLEPPSISVEVSDVNADVHEDGNPDVDPNNEHRKTETVKPDETKEVATADGTKAKIPSGAVPKEDKIKIKALSAASLPAPLPPAESGLKSAGVFREFTFESGLKTFQTPITLTLPYLDENNDGYVDGTDIHESELRLYYFDEASRQWMPVTTMERFTAPATRVTSGGSVILSHDGKRIEAQLNHFTLFALFAARLAATAANVIVYPNPAIVPQGMRLIAFDGLPASGKIQIYSIAGRLVKETEYGALNAGRWSWNLTTDQGEEAASGAYLYVVTDTNGVSTRGKLAIVR